MELTTSLKGERCVLKVCGDFGIYSANEAKWGLLGALEGCRELEVDLSGVVEFDTAGVQLLLLLKREATEQGKQLVLNGHSAAVLDVIGLLGVAAMLGDPLVLPSVTGH